MFKTTKLALCAAIVLGVSAPVALASDNSGDYTGGFVVEGSMDGVNPIYHPDMSGKSARTSAAAAHAQANIDQSHKQSARR